MAGRIASAEREAKKTLPLVDVLLEHGADINARSNWKTGHPQEHVRTLQLLLEAGSILDPKRLVPRRAVGRKNPDSPHLLIPQMRAQFLIAIAENDDRREPACAVPARCGRTDPPGATAPSDYFARPV